MSLKILDDSNASLSSRIPGLGTCLTRETMELKKLQKKMSRKYVKYVAYGFSRESEGEISWPFTFCHLLFSLLWTTQMGSPNSLVIL